MTRQRWRSSMAWRHTRDRVLAGATTCGLCGEPLRPDLRYPHPLSSSVDHTRPMAQFAELNAESQKHIALDVRGLVACHLRCNQQKSDRVAPKPRRAQSRDWYGR